jgi:hypothetical protein
VVLSQIHITGLESLRVERNLELEAAIRENPDDDAAWSILEDWTLERGGLRARIIELEKAGKIEEARKATWELARDILGDDHELARLGVSFTWRAGYVLAVSVATKATSREGVLDRVFALPCTTLMRELRVDIDAIDELVSVTRRLAGRPVRQLEINAFWKPAAQKATFEPRWLAPTVVERLQLFGRAIAVPYSRELARMRLLWLTPGAPGDLRDLFEHENGLPNLGELALYLGTLEHRHGIRPELFTPLFDGRLPALRDLYARDASAELQAALTRAAASGRVKLHFGYR